MSENFALIPDRKEIAILSRIYSVAQKEITAQLLRLDFADYKELAATSIEKKIDVILRRLNRLAIRWTKDTVPIAYTEGYRKSVSMLDKIGADKDPFFELKKHRNSVDDYIDLTANDFIKANQSIRQNVSTYLMLSRQATSASQQIQAFDLRNEEIIAGLLDEAIREGASRQVLQQKIRIHFQRKLYEQKFININGRDYNLIKYAKMVARTRLRRVQSEAVKNTSEQYENDLVEISDHGTECEICKEFEGNVYSISGNTPGYPMLMQWPGFHPNCVIPKTKILTNKGLKKINDIKKGDMVYTHKGRFRPVLYIMKRKFDGQLIWINGLGITYNHQMFTKSGLIPAGNLTRHDELFEFSSEAGKLISASINSDYFPSQRNKFSVPLSILLPSFPMSFSVDFKINIIYRKIKDIFINNFFLNKINVKLFENINSKFSHFRLIFQKIFCLTQRHSFSNFRISRGIIINHPNFIFPISFRSRISNASRFEPANRISFNSKMIKNIYNPMSIGTIQTDNFSNFFHIPCRFITIFYNFFKWFFKSRLDSINSIQKLLSLSTSERAGFGIPTFNRLPTNNTKIHNDSFISKKIVNYSPKMLAYNGEVVNIEVQDDHSYVAEGFLVKNCEHSASPTSEAVLGIREQFA